MDQPTDNSDQNVTAPAPMTFPPDHIETPESATPPPDTTSKTPQPQKPETQTPPPLSSSVQQESSPPNKKKVFLAIISLLVLVGGVATGVFLVKNQQIFKSKACDCQKYTFNVDHTGIVTANNNSDYDEPPQEATVFINSQQVAIFDVPELNLGQSATLGTVSVPSSSGFTWKVEGTQFCVNTGSYEAQISASCNEIKAYDTDQNPLSLSDLTALSEGDSVIFTVSGTTNSGNFDKARFSVNGTQSPEIGSTLTNGEFFYEYIIPAGVTSFSVNAQIHHQELNQWF